MQILRVGVLNPGVSHTPRTLIKPRRRLANRILVATPARHGTAALPPPQLVRNHDAHSALINLMVKQVQDYLGVFRSEVADRFIREKGFQVS